MGFAGIRNPGHSGTSFKHKKVFSNRKSISISKESTESKQFNDDKFEKPTQEIRRNFNSNSNKYLGFFMTLLVLMVLAFIFKVIRVEAQAVAQNNQEILELIDERKNKTKYNGYLFLVNSGNRSLNLDDPLGAIEEFQLAIDLMPKAKQAYVGMARALLLSCEKQNKYCEAAEKYYEYLGQ